MNPESPRSQLVTIPGAIIIAGAIMAMAIVWVRQPARVPLQAAAAQNAPTMGAINSRAIAATDHIYGNPNAPVKILEYSDPSCPYCKTFNPTMEKIMTDYGPSGKVAWIYRHFPLDKPDPDGNILHPNAGHEAQALECAASLGGNDAFWAFEKKLYETTPSVTGQTPKGLDQAQLPVIAKDIGLNPDDFNVCLSGGQFKDKVEADYTDGINAGVSGTPYSLIITPSGNKIPIVGAQPYSAVKSAVDALLTASN